jgi:CHAT domain-containing protein
VLGQVDKAPGTDGYVTAGEWPGYDLRSDLVVLSACDTGLGKVVQGEGVMGLSYALYVAGNRNTLLSLWPVVDESTAEFMTAFFTKLKTGMAQSEALNRTKREFIAGSRFARPVFWAPFVLYGY